jgi:hypothetical protein
LKAFFDEKGILLHKLDGYTEVLEVKKVSNNIKHNDELTEEINKIPEFSGGMEFEDLEDFFNRVKPKVAMFQQQLSVAVVKELFEFDDKKISDIVEEMRGRMGKEDVVKLISKLKNKYGL